MARNAGWNLVGIAVPFVAGLATIPLLTRELGPARFGIIGLAWAILEYLTLVDVGLGRATVHFVARRLRDPGGPPGDVVSASVVAQLLLGTVGGLALAVAAPWLAGTLLAVPPELVAETRTAFLVLAATIPVLLLGLALRAILEGAERFDVAALIRIPSSTATFVVPAAAAVAGASVPQILLALLAVRAVTCAATWVAVRRCVPRLRWSRPASWSALRPLVAFGGWVAVSNFLTPVFLLLDRLVLGAVVGVAAVGFYTGPYEAAVRLLVVPAAVVMAVFPRASAAAAAAAAGGGTQALLPLYLAAVRSLSLVMLGVTAAGVALAPELLTLWLGAEYAASAATAAQLLLAGVLVNAVAHVPFAFVQALGRPDLTARLHLLELVVHVPLTLFLVHRWGVSGAGAAWAARALLDLLLVTAAAHRLLDVRAAALFAGRWWQLLGVLLGLGAALAATHALAHAPAVSAPVWLAALAAIGLAFGAVAWRALLLPSDRASLRAALARAR